MTCGAWNLSVPSQRGTGRRAEGVAAGKRPRAGLHELSHIKAQPLAFASIANGRRSLPPPP